MNNSEKLKLLEEKVRVCNKCAEFDRSNPAAGYGNCNAKIVLIGEAQGQEEVKQGRPFVGKSGQLLTNILTAAGLDRDKDLYITNICKCRPPENRAPTLEESQNCRVFLDLQLKIIRPQRIVCLGATAAQKLLGVDTPIGKLRGQWFKYGEAWVLASFHPAYLLRNPAAKKDAWEDWQMLLSSLQSEKMGV